MDNIEGNVSLKSRAYNVIKNKIVTCEIMPDSPISEKDLMKEIGVSRTPIREALSSLENENLVKIYPKRGIFAAGITEKDIVDIYTVRESIEPTAAKLATFFIDEEVLTAFHSIYSSENYSPSFSEHIEMDRQFHTLIAESSHNDYLCQILLKMYDHNSRIRYRLFKMRINAIRMEQSQLEHLELIQCLRNMNPEGAERIMRIHIHNGMNAAMKILKPVPTEMMSAL